MPQKPLKLSPEELSLLRDRAIMPTKQSLLIKLEKHLAHLSRELKNRLRENPSYLPTELINEGPKISKGENYNMQPYRVLDYPRVFSGKDIFTFRTLILWGHSIGFHLILGGKYREIYLEAVMQNISKLPQGFFISRQDTPWIWEQEAGGLFLHNSLKEETLKEILEERLFIKLSYFIDLQEYEKIVEKGTYVWKQYVACISTYNM